MDRRAFALINIYFLGAGVNMGGRRLVKSSNFVSTRVKPVEISLILSSSLKYAAIIIPPSRTTPAASEQMYHLRSENR